MVRAEDVELDGGEVADAESWGWDERLSGHVEWSHGEDLEFLSHRGWLVWRGEPSWLSPEIVERAWAMCRIGVRIDNDADADLRDITDLLPAMRSLRINARARVRGYGELARAQWLRELDIRPTPKSDADLSGLTDLIQYRGPSFGRWASVLTLPELSYANVEEVTGPIASPVKTLTLGSRRTETLPELTHPAALRALHVVNTRRFDLSSLEKATGLIELNVASDGLTNLHALTRMRALTDVYLDGKTDEDTSVLTGLTAASAEIFLRPEPKAELVDVAVERGWSIDGPDRMLRAAWEKTGRPYPYDDDDVVTIDLDLGRIEIDPDYLGVSFIAARPDLPGSFSGDAAEQSLMKRLSNEWGRAFVQTLEGDSEGEMLVIRCPDERAARIVAAEATKLFAAH